MNGPRLQFALRQMQVHFSDVRVLGAMALVALILGFSGPFGTYEYLPIVPRLLYWAAIVIATYGLGTAIGMSMGEMVRALIRSPMLRAGVYGVTIGPAVTLAVLVINVLAFGPAGLTLIDTVTLLFNCILVAIAVSAISEMVGNAVRGAAQTAAPIAAGAEPLPPPLMERLALPQRGKLLGLSATDHYVEVLTDKGKTLLLMRLADAMRETGSTVGVQIHRSHWVALDAVTRVFRADGKPMVELSDGTRMPISRGFLPAAREAGLVV